MKCDACKYFRHGMDMDYYPCTYCTKGMRNSDNCPYYDESYTTLDWLSECWFGLLVVLLFLLFNLICG